MSFPRYPSYKPSGVEWLGDVPAHWTIAGVGYRYEVALGKMLDEKRITGRHLAPYVKNSDVQWDSINVTDLREMDFDERDRERYSLRSGDLLVCEGGEVGRCAVWTGPLAECYYQKALHRLRPHNSSRDTPLFVRYVLRAASERGAFASDESKATIAHLPAEALRRYRFPFPPVTEQQAIAAFLDRETATIDALVAEQERLIELLKEKRQAVTSHAVTKGLNPDAPMKPSGAEWLGEIPVSWDVIHSRRLFRARNEPARPTDEQLTASQKYGMLPQAEFMERGGRGVVQIITGTDSLRHVEPDDFVISLRSFQGGLEWCRQAGAITFHYVALVPQKHVLPDFFAFLFKSNAYIQALRATANLIRDGQDLRYSHFVQVPLPVVPLADQGAIAAFLGQATQRFDDAITTAANAVALLSARRAALVAAAVTGHIDVRPSR